MHNVYRFHRFLSVVFLSLGLLGILISPFIKDIKPFPLLFFIVFGSFLYLYSERERLKIIEIYALGVFGINIILSLIEFFYNNRVGGIISYLCFGFAVLFLIVHYSCYMRDRKLKSGNH